MNMQDRYACSGQRRSEEKYIFISFSDTPWVGPWYVRQKLMTEFAKEHKAIYAGSRIDARLIWQKIKQGKLHFGMRFVNRNLIVVSSPMIFPRLYRWKRLDALIEVLYILFLKALVLIFGFRRIPVLYIWESKFAKMRKYFSRALCVYHVYDARHKYVYEGKNERGHNADKSSAEEELACNSHLLYAVSPNLCEHYQSRFNRRPKLMINGVSEDYFNLSDSNCEHQAATILSRFPKNRVCFFGSIIGALDLDLVIENSGHLPDHHFIFLGSVRYQNNPAIDGKVDRLLGLPNVHHIGPFGPKLLPYLLNKMDVFLLLYAKTDQIWTYYSSPAKLFEYMALGKPIVSTPHPFVQGYSDIVHIARNSSEFCSLLRDLSRLKAETNSDAMRAMAREHIWSRKKKQILGDLNTLSKMRHSMTPHCLRSPR